MSDKNLKKAQSRNLRAKFLSGKTKDLPHNVLERIWSPKACLQEGKREGRGDGRVFHVRVFCPEVLSPSVTQRLGPSLSQAARGTGEDAAEVGH